MSGELVDIYQQIDDTLISFEQTIKKGGVEFIWQTGAALLEAKEKIIELTGDGRAPGFQDWVKRKFNWNPSTARRYIRAYTDRIEDIGLLWGNKSRALTHEIIDLPDDKYNIIYADPPWRYDFAKESRIIEKHYPTMSLDDLIGIGEDIKELAYKDATLLLWATTAKLDWAFPVLTAWGFEYKTSLVWDKVDYNMGYYWSQRHELLLVGGRGSSAPTVEDKKVVQSIDSVQSIPKSKIHSKKPGEIRNIIDRLWPESKKIELFAREKGNWLRTRSK